MRRSPQDPRRTGDARGRGAAIEPKDADAVDSRVEQLTRELADAINDAQASGRAEMRDYAIDLLRDSVGSEVAERTGPPSSAAARPPLNPFALGIPILLIGALLTVIFPPIGAAMLGVGTVTCLVGMAMAMFRSARERWRSRTDVR